ncbi:hypothetical protein BDC45DRAFT_518807 [Circinella umbellata]|nr:hypothetical protein BDC45DRAFT_518807 [Circinella umbellata]
MLRSKTEQNIFWLVICWAPITCMRQKKINCSQLGNDPITKYYCSTSILPQRVFVTNGTSILNVFKKMIIAAASAVAAICKCL